MEILIELHTQTEYYKKGISH